MQDKRFGIDEASSYNIGLGGGFLHKWQDDGEITLWLHPTVDIYHPWFHDWCSIGESKEKKDPEGTTVVRHPKILCPEREAILKRNTKRYRNPDGSREFPPQTCPHCFLDEHVRTQIEMGELDWCTPIFEFKADKGDAIVYAGGMCGLFDPYNLSDEEVEEMTEKTGIVKNEAFKASQIARRTFVFNVVKHDDTESGVILADQPKGLFKAYQKATASWREDCEDSNGKVDGRLSNNPKAMRWRYKDKDASGNSVQPSDRYSAAVRGNIDMPPHVEEAFGPEAELPDMSRYETEPNWVTQLEAMKKHALIDLPFDELFANVDVSSKSSASVPEDIKSKETSKVESSANDTEEANDSEETNTEEEYDTSCEHCGHDMGETTTCSECGTVYELDEDEEVYVIKSRPCANEDCMEKAVMLNAHTGSSECSQCGAIHDNKTWKCEIPKPKTESPKGGKKKSSKKKVVSKKTVSKAAKSAAKPSKGQKKK